MNDNKLVAAIFDSRILDQQTKSGLTQLTRTNSSISINGS
jgi:hypothetical protein